MAFLAFILLVLVIASPGLASRGSSLPM